MALGCKAASCLCTKTITVSGTDHTASSLICVFLIPILLLKVYSLQRFNGISCVDLGEQSSSIDKAWAELEVDTN